MRIFIPAAVGADSQGDRIRGGEPTSERDSAMRYLILFLAALLLGCGGDSTVLSSVKLVQGDQPNLQSRATTAEDENCLDDESGNCNDVSVSSAPGVAEGDVDSLGIAITISQDPTE